jgi:hypothetical protein
VKPIALDHGAALLFRDEAGEVLHDARVVVDRDERCEVLVLPLAKPQPRGAKLE